jgi:MtN3 and saliva related transmembrane protein
VSLNDVIGSVAAFLTTSAFVPQAWMTWKNRSAHGISLGMYVVFVLGVGLWLWYGVNLGSFPIIAANAVTLSLALFILVMKLRFG